MSRKCRRLNALGLAAWAAMIVSVPSVAMGSSGQAAQVAVSEVMTEAAEFQDVLRRYCTSCHSDRLRTAGLTLESLDVSHVAAGAEVWEKVIRKLNHLFHVQRHHLIRSSL